MRGTIDNGAQRFEKHRERADKGAAPDPHPVKKGKASTLAPLVDRRERTHILRHSDFGIGQARRSWMMMEPVSVHWDPRVLDTETRSDVLWFPSQPPDNPQAELGASVCHRLRECRV